ncbi:MAG: M23 family metallopeptidase, partial [Bacteroidales bacterium]|nr:M23 family metallopeptidase [Bacteroidales bacterium]
MVKNKIGLLYILFLICAVNFVCQAEIIPPLKRSLQLTGNFGELRTNHFHTGLDFRASIGTPVYAVDSGYVSRITVSAGGYGNALYITHPSGITSVYAHLNAFAPKIEEALKQYQMQLKYYAVDLSFSPTDIQVEREEIVAYTGNRGSSGGPHLHFEIRNTQTQNPLEPLYYLKDKIKDTRSPKIKAISIMPYRGVINNANIQTIKVEKNSVVPQIKAWGDVIFAVEAYDYMDGMRNIYGVHYVNLYKDEELIYSSYIDTLSFDKGRQINTYINSEQFLKDKSLYMQSFIAPGNTLPFYEKNNISNNGVVTIDEERVYKFRYEVFDYYGNKDEYAFEIVGEDIECKPIEQEYVEY